MKTICKEIACLLCVSIALGIRASAQVVAHLHTTDTEVTLQAEASAARLVSLKAAQELPWTNRASEKLARFIEMQGRTVPVTWHFDQSSSHMADREVVFVYESSAPHLRLTWEWRAPSAHGPLEHQIRIQNLEREEIWLPVQDSLAFAWRIDPRESLLQVYVEKGANRPSAEGTHEVAFQEGDRWSGISSTYGDVDPREPREIIPWLLVQRRDADRSGWYAGIEFSGRTRFSLARKKDSLSGEAGLNPDPAPFRTRLKPGETFETPVVFLGGFRGGPDGAGNLLRPWVREVLGNAETWKNPAYPMAVNNSWGGGMEVNEETARRMIGDSAELGIEMFHLDAGWFRGVGHWYPDARKFPHGLAAIAEEAHRQGLKFGLWVDWAQAGLGTDSGALNARDPKVRDWLVTDLPENWQPEPFKGQTIDLGVPEAKAWAQREVERIVTDYRLDMLEHDGYLVARGCSRTDHPHAAPDPLNERVYQSGGSYFVDSSNSTDVSYHAVRAYYEIQAQTRQKHPGLLFEICNDGGRMVDFGSAAHGDYFSITDAYDPLSNRRAFFDASHVLPAAMLESYVEKWPVSNLENFRYMLRSGMMGWFTLMLDTTAWPPEQHDAAKEEIAMYKRQLRPLIRDANLYHISRRPDGVHWDGMEYFDQTLGKGAVYAFRGSARTENCHRFLLGGLRETDRYRLRFHDQPSSDRVISGRELARHGLAVRLPRPNSSEIIFLEKVGTTGGRDR
jgi:hypothetical protein